MPGRAPDYRATPAGSGGSKVTVNGQNRSAEDVNAMANWKAAQDALLGQLVAMAPGLVQRKDEKIATNAARREKLEQAIVSGQIPNIQGGQEIRADEVGFVFESDDHANDFWTEVGDATGRGNLDRTREVRNRVRERIKGSYRDAVNNFINIQDALKQNGIPHSENTSEVFTNLLTSSQFGALLNAQGNFKLKPGRTGEAGILDYDLEDEGAKKALQDITSNIISGNITALKGVPEMDAGVYKRVHEYFKEAASGSGEYNVREDFGALKYNPLIERDVDRDAQYTDEIKTSMDRLLAGYTMEGLTGMLGGAVGSNRPWNVDEAARYAAQARDRQLSQDDRLQSRYHTDSQTLRGGSTDSRFGETEAEAAARWARSLAGGADVTSARYHAPAAAFPPPSQALGLYGKTSALDPDPANPGKFIPQKDPQSISGNMLPNGDFEFTNPAGSRAGHATIRELNGLLRNDWSNATPKKIADYYQTKFNPPGGGTNALNGYKAEVQGGKVVFSLSGRVLATFSLLKNPANSRYESYMQGAQHNPIEIHVFSGTKKNELNPFAPDTFTNN